MKGQEKRARMRRRAGLPHLPERGTCGKFRYSSEAQASKALAHAQRDAPFDEKRREQRYYECRRCDGWHLTSQPYVEPSR